MSGQVIAEFLRDLFSTGELLIPALNETQILSALQSGGSSERRADESIRTRDLDADVSTRNPPMETLEGVLFSAERTWRNELPNGVPDFDIAVAKRAAVVMFAVCRSMSDARFPACNVEAIIEQSGLGVPAKQSDHYSADLVLHYLPQLEERSRRLDDQHLKAVVRRLCRDWPLSSVGVRDIAACRLPDGLKTDGLFRVFVDRVLATHDPRWMVESSVRTAIESALGPFEELNPELRRMLASTTGRSEPGIEESETGKS